MVDVIQEIKNNYPMYVHLLKYPEISKLLRDAVDPDKGFSPQEFQARLYSTNYFRTRSAKRREWEALWATDPAEARRRANVYKGTIRSELNKLGFKYNENQVRYIAAYGLQNGEDLSDPNVRFRLFNFMRRQSPKAFTNGAINGGIRDVKTRARGDYYVNLTAREAVNWGTALALGQRDQSSLEQFLSAKAMSLYPHLRRSLQAGKTMSDLFDGHKQVIAEELEVDPDTINFANRSKWSQVLDFYDKNEKSHRAYTLSETRTLARQDPRFWNTANGKQMGSSMANTILAKFGKRA